MSLTDSASDARQRSIGKHPHLPMNVIIHIDGGSRGNPGPAGVGVVIHDAGTRKPLHEAGYFVGRTTNNVAEYTGLLRALELARELGATAIDVRSDSQLMVRQLHGQYRVKSADLRPLFEQARERLSGFSKWTLHHVPREKNERADELANLAMDARRDVIATANGEVNEPTSATRPGPAATAAPPGSSKGSAVDKTAKAVKAGPVDAEAMWQITLEGDTADCPAHTPAGHTVAMGPTVGDGLLCLHAAAALFATGLPAWPATRRKTAARCAVCARRIHVQRA